LLPPPRPRPRCSPPAPSAGATLGPSAPRDRFAGEESSSGAASICAAQTALAGSDDGDPTDPEPSSGTVTIGAVAPSSAPLEKEK
jgi:hypothetical protein